MRDNSFIVNCYVRAEWQVNKTVDISLFIIDDLMIGSRAKFEAMLKDYQVYVLRIWQDGNTDPRMRLSLEDTHTGKQKGFGSPKALVDYLEGMLADSKSRVDGVMLKG